MHSPELLKGQEELRSLLAAALDNGKLSHAVLLTGPSGVGKTVWGKILAKAILCDSRKGMTPCNACTSCLRFENGNNADYFHLEPEKNKLKKEQFKEVRDWFYLRSRRKVCLIDRSEMMTAETASSLLKIMEDPPDGLTFILLAGQVEDLFDTIVSRCQRYVVQPLGFEVTADLLVNSFNLDREKAEVIARLSRGLPGYAFKAAEDPDFDERYRKAKELTYNLASGKDSAFRLLASAAELSERDDLVSLLEIVELVYRDGMIRGLATSCQDGFDGEPTTWLDRILPEELETAIEFVDQTLYEITRTNANRRLLLEKMLILLQRRFLHGHSSRNPV